jgi:hypothetical protein
MKYRKLFFMISMLLPAFAIASSVSTFNAAALKTLFTSPTERNNIDASRQGVFTTGSSTMPTGPSSVHVNGIVTRGNNKSVVWINGKNTLDNTMVDGVKVYPNSMKKDNKIPVRVDGRMVYVKPGETWSEGSGTADVTDR